MPTTDPTQIDWLSVEAIITGLRTYADLGAATSSSEVTAMARATTTLLDLLGHDTADLQIQTLTARITEQATRIDQTRQHITVGYNAGRCEHTVWMAAMTASGLTEMQATDAARLLERRTTGGAA